MTRRRGSWLSCSLVAAALGSAITGCGAIDAGAERAAPAQAETVCTTASAGGGWVNQGFPAQTRMFHAEFDATPSTSSLDAVVGLSEGSATGFTQLAAIVRFNATGTVDVRSGSSYRADQVFEYRAGESYHVRIDVDARTGVYSVFIRSAGFASSIAIARSYPFRTEQAGTTTLDNAASEVDSATGTLQVCGFTVVTDNTTGDGCVIARAGDGFSSVAVSNASVLETATFTAQPDTPGLDAVIGLSSGSATRFADLATALRFAPSGSVDVRDGDGYRADLALPYATDPLRFRMIADLSSHSYSVVHGSSASADEIARQYRFRTEQAAATRLDHLSLIVDGPQGSIKLCEIDSGASVNVPYSKEGRYAVAPLDNGQALLSDGATTSRVDPAGRVLASAATGGELAIDAAGNAFVARAQGTTLSVDSYDPGLALRWHSDTAIQADDTGPRVIAMAVGATGMLRVGVVFPSAGIVQVYRFNPAGALQSYQSSLGNAVAIDGDQTIFAFNQDSTLTIRWLGGDGVELRERQFAGTAAITAMTVDPDHDLIFGGQLDTPIDFGGGPLPTRSNPEGPVNGFIAKFTATGNYVFAQRTGFSTVDGIATNGPRIAVSSTERTQFHYLHFNAFNADGTALDAYHSSTGFAGGGLDHGFGGRLAMSRTGRVWWNLDTQWPNFPRWPYLVVFPE